MWFFKQGIGPLLLAADSEPDAARRLTHVGEEGVGLPEDLRVTDLRHRDRVYDFPAYATRQEWEARAADLRQHILVSTGLWPLPEKTPLNAQIFDRLERDGYTVEKVYFESYPGFLVTGNLYRPRGRTGPFPGILNPHGHWANGRLANEESGSIPGRCINQARQGYVAFSYDMVGYNDSRQVDHGYGADPRQHLWGISLMGLQLWNSIRALDFLSSLPDVDPTRLGCTGESGGGTQTFMLSAVDERVQVAVPVNMISAHFQGGCLCENAPNLRLDTFNVEIAALFAPKPLLLVSCTGDWTKNTPQVEFPAIQSIYRLYGAEEKVQWVQRVADHNYNRDSREAAYAWFGRWFQGVTDPARLQEQPFEVEAPEDLLVFARREPPPHLLDAEGLTKFLIGRAEAQLNALKPTDAASLARFREVMEPALRHTLAAEVPAPEALTEEVRGTVKGPDFTATRLLIGRTGKGDCIPAVLYRPARGGVQAGTLVVSPEGKAAWVDVAQAAPGPLVAGLLRQGQAVLAIDAFGTGERAGAKRDESLAFFTTFNRTDTALRVQDILTGLAYLRRQVGGGPPNLVGLGEAGLWALLARGLDPGVARTAVDTAQFDNTRDEGFLQHLYVPGLRRAGDLRTAGTLAAPAPLWLFNTGPTFQAQWIVEAYRAAGAAGQLRLDPEQVTPEALAAWVGGE
jgi:dienelactone hydrolase